jgi:hypothetical protein
MLAARPRHWLLWHVLFVVCDPCHGVWGCAAQPACCPRFSRPGACLLQLGELVWGVPRLRYLHSLCLYCPCWPSVKRGRGGCARFMRVTSNSQQAICHPRPGRLRKPHRTACLPRHLCCNMQTSRRAPHTRARLSVHHTCLSKPAEMACQQQPRNATLQTAGQREGTRTALQCAVCSRGSVATQVERRLTS